MGDIYVKKNADCCHGGKGLGPEDIAVLLTKQQREKITAGYDFKILAKIFEDGEMMRTVNAFLANGMNVSRAARQLFMHRNTLSYRLNCIKKQTGLDLRNFDMAMTFIILHIFYDL